MAYALKARSNCVRESVGSVLVKDKRIIGAGYNGTPSNSANCFEFGCNDCRQHPMGKPQLDKCICLHAEEASILEAGVIKYIYILILLIKIKQIEYIY